MTAVNQLKISAIRAFSDNYIWAIHNDSQAIIVDPGEAEPVLAFLSKQQLTLAAILITHHHHDHVGGVAKLQEAHPDVLTYAHSTHTLTDQFQISHAVNEGDVINLLDHQWTVWHTPGHTDSHLSYLVDINGVTHVFCADTLFSGGCGRVFTGTMRELHDSMLRFNTLPSDTLFYPAHEYTLSNLRFGLSVAGATKQTISRTIQQLEQTLAADGISLPTTLAQERIINVFFQTDDADLIQCVAEQHALADTDSLSVFTALRELKNNF